MSPNATSSTSSSTVLRKHIIDSIDAVMKEHGVKGDYDIGLEIEDGTATKLVVSLSAQDIPTRAHRDNTNASVQRKNKSKGRVIGDDELPTPRNLDGSHPEISPSKIVRNPIYESMDDLENALKEIVPNAVLAADFTHLTDSILYI